MIRAISGFLICLQCAAASAQSPDYRLNPGDILEVSVWKEEGMQREVLVLPDGTISFPLAGHLQAAGKTPRAVQEDLRERLKDYIPDSPVTVSVLSTSGNKIYVVGQVNSPGEFPVNRTIDVMQALSLAGGLTQWADEDRIRILRRAEDGSQDALPFDYSAVAAGSELESNVQLRSGDVVVVPEGL